MINEKQNFTKQLFEYLSEINFAILEIVDGNENTKNNPDLDLFLESNEVDPILGFARNHPSVEKMLTRFKKSMVQTFIHFHDGSFLQLDLMFKHQRVEYEYMVTMEVFGNKEKAEPGSKPSQQTDSLGM